MAEQVDKLPDRVRFNSKYHKLFMQNSMICSPSSLTSPSPATSVHSTIFFITAPHSQGKVGRLRGTDNLLLIAFGLITLVQHILCIYICIYTPAHQITVVKRSPI